MSWDWDKLQEKRQRQQWSRPEQPQNGDSDDRSPLSDLFDFFNSSKRRGDNGGNNDNGNFNNGNGGGNQDPFPEIKMPSFSGLSAKWLLLIPIAWLLSGIYIVNPDEQGVVLRFGKYDRTVDAGPHYALPYPIETVDKPKVTQVQRVEIGFRSAQENRNFQQGKTRPVPEEASMLTGDENIVNVAFSVQYQIKDAVEYLYRVTNQAAVVKKAAEAAMREVIGNIKIDSVLTDGKLKVQNDATRLLQDILDRYEVGVRVLAVQLQDVTPPDEVVTAFKDVASAREDKSRIINEAEAYNNEILPKARGTAVEIENKAQAYKETRIRNAKGETNRFLALLAAYESAKDVTKQRLYLEAMEEILSKPGMEKIILPSSSGDKTLPLIPLFTQPVKTGK